VEDCRLVKRTELTARMAHAAGWSRAATDRAMRAMLGGIVGAIKRGDSVTLAGFGTFSATRRRPRVIVNPRTGKAATITGRVPRFKPSKELKRTVR
jgi:DNA-binding protein HU-beta